MAKSKTSGERRALGARDQLVAFGFFFSGSSRPWPLAVGELTCRNGKAGALSPGLVLFKSFTPPLPHAIRDEPCVTRFTTMAAIPASTALACGDDSMSMIGFDAGACP